MPVLVWVIGESPNSKQWKKLFSYYCLFIYYCSNKHFSGILFLYKELPSTPLLQTSQNIIVLLCLKEMFSFCFQRKSDYIFFLFQIFMGKSINHFWQLTIFIYFDASCIVLLSQYMVRIHFFILSADECLPLAAYQSIRWLPISSGTAL